MVTAGVLASWNTRPVSGLAATEVAAARAAEWTGTAATWIDVPVVPVTETLPPGRTFQQWQTDQARALMEAL